MLSLGKTDSSPYLEGLYMCIDTVCIHLSVYLDRWMDGQMVRQIER